MKIVPNSLEVQPHLVAAILYERLCTFEFSIAAEVFGLPRPEMGKGWYRFVTASEEKAPVSANGGILVQAQYGLEALRRAKTIVVPGWRSEDEKPSDALAKALLDAHKRGARIVSVCSGAFLLAQLGLLDGRRATTHWSYARKLAARYPKIRVDPDVLYVDEGDVLTSAGSAAGVDLLLHLVRKDHGAEAANLVPRRMVLAPHRDGGQRQFVSKPVARSPEDRLRPLIDDISADLGRRWTIADMAGRAAMSRRTFIRRFAEATGASPGEWLSGQRLQRAQDQLESTAAPLAEIAHIVGFGTVATLQHHFRRQLRTSPSRYREKFRG